MGVVNTKSTSITNADASPKVLNSSYFEDGIVRSSVGTVEIAAADSDGSVYRFCRVPSNARIIGVKYFCDAITGGTSYDFGLYQTAANGGAVLLSTAYGSAVDISAGTTVGVDVVFEAKDIANIEKRVWEDGAVAADPGIQYDIACLANTVGSGAGTLSVVVTWTV